MNEYEVFIEDINSCGGEQYAKKELIEVEADSSESFVKENGRFPILDISENAAGDTVILTGDGIGNMLRYTFSECCVHRTEECLLCIFWRLTEAPVKTGIPPSCCNLL